MDILEFNAHVMLARTSAHVGAKVPHLHLCENGVELPGHGDET